MFNNILLSKPVDGEEIDNSVIHYSETAQLERLFDERKKRAALVSQTRVSCHTSLRQ